MQLDWAQPVVVEITEDGCVPGMLHLPVRSRTWRTGSTGTRVQGLCDYKDLPLEWHALCGTHGYLYIYEGVSVWQLCTACAAAATAGMAVGWWAPPATARVA